MKIGVLTYHNAWNYGARLQAYCLISALNQYKNIDAEIIDLILPSEGATYKVKIRKSWPRTYELLQRKKAFRNDCMQLKKSEYSIRSADLIDFHDAVDNCYDIVIVGSDEVWNIRNFRGIRTPYYLPGNIGCKKVSFAASGYHSFSELNNEDLTFVKQCLADFDYISVRDISTYNNVRNLLGEKANIHINLDPTLLGVVKGDSAHGEFLLKKRGVDVGKPVIGVMIYGSDAGKKIKEKFGDRYSYVSLYNYQYGIKNILDINPFDWVDIISYLSFFMTSYFHGTCYSIVNQVPFCSVDVLHRENNSKIKYLLDSMNMTEHCCFGIDSLLSSKKVEKEVYTPELFENKEIDTVFKQARMEFDSFVSSIISF